MKRERWDLFERTWLSEDGRVAGWRGWHRDFWRDTALRAALTCNRPDLKSIFDQCEAAPMAAKVTADLVDGAELVYGDGCVRKVHSAWAFASLIEAGWSPVDEHWRMFARTVTHYATMALLQRLCLQVICEAREMYKLKSILITSVTAPCEQCPVKKASVSQIMLTCLATVKMVAALNLDPLNLPLSGDEMEFLRQSTRVFVLVQKQPLELKPKQRRAILCWYAVARGQAGDREEECLDIATEHFA